MSKNLKYLPKTKSWFFNFLFRKIVFCLFYYFFQEIDKLFKKNKKATCYMQVKINERVEKVKEFLQIFLVIEIVKEK